MPGPSPLPISFVKGVDYDFEVPRYSTILSAQPGAIQPQPANTTNDPLGTFILCKEFIVERGIWYTATYFEDVFPITWVVILDARATLKNFLLTELGIGGSKTLVSSNATSFMVQLSFRSALLGQPVERGLKSRSTARYAMLSTTVPSVISLVSRSALYLQLPKTFIHRLRTRNKPFTCP